jgi:hypothetical protein
MTKHEVDTSVVVWAIRYLLLLDHHYQVWDGVRLIREHASYMPTNYVITVYDTVLDRITLLDHDDLDLGDNALVTGLTDIKAFLETVLQERSLEYRLSIP